MHSVQHNANLMKRAVHFLWASVAATLAAMALLTVTMPLTLFATTGSVTGEGFWPSLGAMVVMLPFVVLIGGVIALPTAALAGGAILWAEKRRATPFAARTWTITGLAAGLLVSLIVGTNDPVSARLVHIPWFASAGAMGAWVFARVWRQG
jgi:hypothetical protein